MLVSQAFFHLLSDHTVVSVDTPPDAIVVTSSPIFSSEFLVLLYLKLNNMLLVYIDQIDFEVGGIN